ncbi:MAG: alpha/beta hydrolase [Gammaproteobacteria bacterium]|nr:alpha/beta hydrolase [Gammaproteobacteria bacterium]
MQSYKYNPALRAPGNWTGIDFSDPKLKQAIKIMVLNLNEKAKTFKTPGGVTLREEKFTSEDSKEIVCYVFEPINKNEIKGNMLYCHGGGFFLPIQPMMMSLASIYARELSLRVYLPEYRILPEYQNPYPYIDTRTILKYILKEDLPYLLYGESVGGTLAAGLSIWVRNNGYKTASGECLIYPVLDNSFSKYPSIRQYSEAAWPLRNNLTMWTEYLKGGMKLEKEYLIPLKETNYKSLPKTYIEPQEIDILRDEAIEYGNNLKNADVDVIVNVIPGSYHGFDEDLDNDFVKDVVNKRITIMKKMLNVGGDNFNDN